MLDSLNNNEKLQYVQNDIFIMFDNKNLIPKKLEWNKSSVI